MKKPLGARARRIVPIFLAVALGHLAAGLWAESERAAPTAQIASAEPVIPILLAPRLREPPPPPSPKPLHRSLKSRPGPLAPPPQPLSVADDAGLLAPPLPALEQDGPDSSQAHEAAGPALPPPPVSLNPYPVNTGYWRVDEHWMVFSKTEFYCLSAWNILRFMVQPCTHIYHCSYRRQEAVDGKIHFEGVISARGQRYDVRGGGSYSPTEITVSMLGAGHYKFLPVAFTGSLDAHYLSAACPQTAKRIHQGS